MLEWIKTLLMKIASFWGTRDNDVEDDEFEAEMAEERRVLEELSRYIKKHPKDATGFLRRAEYYLEYTEGYPLAMPDLDKAVKLDPNNAKAWALRGGAFSTYYWYNLEEAHQNYAMAMKVLARQYPVRLQRIKTDEELPSELASRLTRLTQDIRNSNRPSELLVERARVYFSMLKSKLGYFDAASNRKLGCRDLNVAIAKDPANVDAYLLRADRAWSPADVDKVERDVQTALELDPSRTDGHCILTAQYFSMGIKHYDLALKSVDDALRINPKHAMAHYLSGLIHRNAQQVPEAVQSFRKAVQYDPFCADAHLNLARLLEAGGDLPAAIAEYWSFVATADKVVVNKIIEVIDHLMTLPDGLKAMPSKPFQVAATIASNSNVATLNPGSNRCYVVFQQVVKAPKEALEWLKRKLSGDFDKDNPLWSGRQIDAQPIEGDDTQLIVLPYLFDDCDEGPLVDAVCEMQVRFDVTDTWVLTIGYMERTSPQEYLVVWAVCYKGEVVYLDPSGYVPFAVQEVVKTVDAYFPKTSRTPNARDNTVGTS